MLIVHTEAKRAHETHFQIMVMLKETSTASTEYYRRTSVANDMIEMIE